MRGTGVSSVPCSARADLIAFHERIFLVEAHPTSRAQEQMRLDAAEMGSANWPRASSSLSSSDAWQLPLTG